MAANNYNIDWDNLLKFIIPSRFWLSNTLNWLKVLIAPVIRRHTEFGAFSADQRYYMQHTSQVIYLEKVLNEKFGPITYNPLLHLITRSITIANGDNPNRDYVFLIAETQPLFLATTQFIETLEENIAQYNDFIINIPTALTIVEASVKAEVNQYKLAGKFYKIVRT